MFQRDKILIADDHPLLLLGMKEHLNTLGYMNITLAKDGVEAYNKIIKEDFEFAILDVNMPGLTGLEILKKVKAAGINTKIILITLHQEKDLFEEAMLYNVNGYIFKHFALEEIEVTLKEISKHGFYFSSTLKAYFKPGYTNEIRKMLSASEYKILILISENLTTPEIADRLFISHKTVTKHRSNIVRKLGIEKKTNSLLLWARENREKLKSL